MDKVLIVYYSRTGTARQVAQQLQQISGWAIAEVRDLRPRVGLIGDLRCVLDSLFARSALYTVEGAAAEGFDRLVLVAPIWLDGLASPMRALVRDSVRPGRPVSLICVMARSGAFRAADEITTIIGAAPDPVVALRQADVLSGSCLASLSVLVDTVNALDADPVVTRPLWLSPEAA